jgi:riboflavin-specific deaminase-like protein
MTETEHLGPEGVVVAGAGLAAQRAVETLRRNGYDGRIRVVAEEFEAPYDRPPLSKAFLAGELDDPALRFRDDAWYADRGVELLLGERAVGLDARARRLELGSGGRLAFSRLLVATGGTPRRLPGTWRFPNVHHLRTVDDARRLRVALSPGARIVVIGAGFIGQEVASTARGLGAAVTIVEAAPAPLHAVLGARLGAWFARLHREEGVEMHLSARIAAFHGTGALEAIELENGARLECDAVVVGIGTALTDDPQLTARIEGVTRQPRRIVFDSEARLPLDSQLVRGAAEVPLTVVVSRAAPRTATDALEVAGAEVIVATGENEPARVRSALVQLGAAGITSILLEGGPRLAGAFLDAGEIDDVRLFVAPVLLGSATARDVLEGGGVERIAEATRALTLDCERSGQDVLLTARLREW